MRIFRTLRGGITAIALLLASVSTADAQQLAFPGAQGWGRFATGGRNGSVYHVTNLNDSGSGSLRDAISQPNRIVVFDVAGVIRINSRLIFSKNLYVAGQTAPGEGVTVYGDGVSFSGSDNIIVRHMRFRMGAVGSKDKDCAGISNGQNMIFDHCSFAWGQDENFSINWDKKGTAPTNITLQNCIVGQGLMTHSAGGLMQADNITLYRLLLVDNSTRNFKVKGINQYVNNIVYNWKNYAYNMGGDSEGTSYVNIENNLFINGPAVGGDALTGGNSDFHYYGNDNWQDKNRDGVFNPTLFTGTGGGDPQSKPYAYPELEKWAGNSLIDNLLPEVGASLPYRDIADCYMIDEVLSYGKKGKLITNENELPYGTPDKWTMYTGEKRIDTDGDGMPDDWETANGTDPAKNDAMVIAANGYANIENYINSITRENRQQFLRAPLMLTLTASTTSSLSLSWADYSDNEDGFIVEIKKGDAFVEAARLAANTTSYTIADESLTPATAYQVRVCAVKGEEKSDYTPELTAKTRPEHVDIIDADAFTGTGDGEWLIAPTSDETITLTEETPKTAVVVRSDANVTLNGTGYISGSASLNKTGKGTLTVATDQHYTGATVLHDGVFEFATLQNGGVASGLGMSQEFAQNWIMDGGIYRYTGGQTTTNRSAQLYNDTELDLANAAVVTMNGSFEGSGNLTINGKGTLGINTANFFKFDGDLIMRGGTVKLNSKTVSDAGIGKAGKLVMAGGAFTTVGKNESSVSYSFPIEAVADTKSTIDFDLWCNINSKVTGTGTLQWNVHYLREYIKGNWDDFTGHLIVNGTGKAGSSQFAIQNGVGVKNATLELIGNAQVNGAKNQSTFYLGGLSGVAGTFLSGFDVKSAGGSGTWIVGGANTNETFRGVIDNRAQGGQEGTTSIVKQGSGDWRLTGANVYKGTTKVEKGRLIVNGNHSGTGAVTVSSNASLAGTGTLAAATTILAGATLQAGDTLINGRGLTFSGKLTLNGNYNVLADSTHCNGITLKTASTIGAGAVLMINEGEGFEKPHYDGTELKVFKFSTTAAKLTGTFTSILPATPGEGQEWDTSKLYSDGILKIVGGEKNPDEGGNTDTPVVDPVGETLYGLIAWGNCERTSYDGSSYTNMLKGAENDEAKGFSLVMTGNLEKSYSSAGTPKLNVDFHGENRERTATVLSNGAQQSLFIPEGARATKLTIWGYINKNSSEAASLRPSYWKEVAGTNYTEAEARASGRLLDEFGAYTNTRGNAYSVSYDLNNVPDVVTFTNTGEQQAIILVVEYHYGGTAGSGTADGIQGISINNDAPASAIQYFDATGTPVSNPGKGIYVIKYKTADGRMVTKKVVR